MPEDSQVYQTACCPPVRKVFLSGAGRNDRNRELRQRPQGVLVLKIYQKYKVGNTYICGHPYILTCNLCANYRIFDIVKALDILVRIPVIFPPLAVYEIAKTVFLPCIEFEYCGKVTVFLFL